LPELVVVQVPQMEAQLPLSLVLVEQEAEETVVLLIVLMLDLVLKQELLTQVVEVVLVEDLYLVDLMVETGDLV
jgi:hypothetical protein